MLTSSCHCGAVKVQIEDKPETLLSCNCSTCGRYGALWAYYTTATAAVIAEPGALKSYSWGDKDIEFYHCTHCGCLSHYELTEKTDDSRVALNARMLPPSDIEGIRIRKFDGADSWEFLDE
jgi:hypothetical protein